MSYGKQFSPNAIEILGKVYYVAQNNANASDDNPGTPEQPFQNISATGAMADAWDIVIIDDGVYREEVTLVGNGTSGCPNPLLSSKLPPARKCT